ncbi:MAG: RcnB family protein, partial [Phenylobacterium sp.]
MKLNIFLSSVAAACLVLPASALADPPSDQGQGAARKEQAQQKGRGAEKGKGAEKGAAAEGRKQGGGAPGQAAKRQEQPRIVAGPQAQPGADRGRQLQAQAAAPVPQRVERAPQRVQRAPEAPSIPRAAPTAPSIQREPGVRAGQQRNPPGVRAGQQQYQTPPVARQQPYQNQPVARQAPPPLGDWRAPAHGPERDRAGQQWRQQHQSWDQYAAWRQGGSDWWRNDSSFRLFNGLRIGFFFVPERGYIALPRQYRERHWQAGDYLPAWFRAYTVRNYARYGLPRPPRGCVWIWLNGDVAL